MPSDAATDELTLITGGQRLSGWQAMRVTRGCERMPSDFEVELVEQYPGDPSEIIVAPGAPCEVLLGADRVLTGYIDRYTASLSAHDHAVRISGRSMCEDLVDSSAILPNMAISGGTFLAIAEKLAEPYGIKVKSQTQHAGDPFKQFNVTLGETPYEIIERVARYFRVLVYDDTDGHLILADVGASSMASGFSIGDNVQSASVTFTADQRFSVYKAARMNTAIGSDIAAQTGIDGYSIGEVSDPGAPTVGVYGNKRLRQLLVVSEQIVDGHDLALSRAEWEMNRRVGRSQALTVVCDSWRDKNGTLWQPNAFTPLYLPQLKLAPQNPWIIGQVTFVRDGQQGTIAELMLMPKEAFSVEPSALQPNDWQVGDALRGGAAARPEARGGTLA